MQTYKINPYRKSLKTIQENTKSICKYCVYCSREGTSTNSYFCKYGEKSNINPISGKKTYFYPMPNSHKRMLKYIRCSERNSNGECSYFVRKISKIKKLVFYIFSVFRIPNFRNGVTTSSFPTNRSTS